MYIYLAALFVFRYGFLNQKIIFLMQEWAQNNEMYSQSVLYFLDSNACTYVILLLFFSVCWKVSLCQVKNLPKVGVRLLFVI